MFKNARLRLAALNVLVFGLLLLLLGFAAYGIFSSHIYSGADAELRHDEDLALAQLRLEGYAPTMAFGNVLKAIPNEYRALLFSPAGSVLETSDTNCNLIVTFYTCQDYPVPPTSKDGLHTVLQQNSRAGAAWQPGDAFTMSTIGDLRTDHFQREPYRVLTFSVAVDGTVNSIFQFGRTVAGEESALAELRILLFFGGALGLLLAAVASLFLADRALVPISQAFARQRQFTADASHELRTPLALIRANAEMLYRHESTATSPDGELVGEIIRETEHLNRMVGDLLTLARADTESLKLISKPLDFRNLVSGVHEDLQTIATSRGISTNVSLDGRVMVLGDETRLRQLLLILLDNALKYTDSGGEVKVSVRKEDGRARLVVSDTGIGIPPKDLPHIFERFYRVDRAREHESGGTGLGLAIARWIVQAHHGSIKVDSESGRGSRFQVDLPTL
ncbi:MAG: sensor histidine kinase [Chloroflexota bacterium]